MEQQLSLDLRPSYDSLAVWSPRDIWNNLTADLLDQLHEDRRVEHKIASIHLDELAKYFSMWSNTSEGGILLIGIDKHRKPEGCLGVGQDKINGIEKLHTNLCPLARPETRRIEVSVGGKSNFVLAIYLPYVGRLVETNRHEAYIRYGDSIHKMSDEEKHDFRSSRHELSWEQQACGLAFPSEFDRSIIREFCDNYRDSESLPERSDEEILELAILGRRTPSGFEANNALALVAGNNPRSLIPGSRVRVQRFEGMQEGQGDTYAPISNKWFDGNIVSILRQAREHIEAILYDFSWMRDGKFITTKEYPFPAWFEALVNCCVHRSYSFSGTDATVKFFEDRMELESPGGFCPPVNAHNIYEVRSARNPTICNALYYLGITRMAREGTRRIRQSMQEWQLPEPKFEQEAIHGVLVRVTLQNDREMRRRVLDRDVVENFGVEKWRLLTEDEMKVAAYAFRNSVVNVSEAQRVTGRTWKTAKKSLDRMVTKGVLQFVPGQYERDPKAHYLAVTKEPENGKTR